MVRTGAVRVSAGKSSKKGGGSVKGTPSQSVGGSKSSSSASALPPITYQETPEWQKPITSFFKSQTPLKIHKNIICDASSEEESRIVQKNDNIRVKELERAHTSKKIEGGNRKKRRLMNLDDSGDEELEKMRVEVQENKENVNKEFRGTSETAEAGRCEKGRANEMSQD